jgi:histone acetyltransferase (RNA polymerase elongator complex component)
MTQEQFQRVIEINNRIEQLNQVKEEIKGVKTFLTYAKRGQTLSGSDSTCRDWLMAYISNILDNHDKQIREEINNEIESLNQEIERL